MASEWNDSRPLTRREYARRRDETTRVEVAKLKASPEYKAFAKDRGIAEHASSKQSPYPLLIAAVVSAIIFAASVGIRVGPRMSEVAPEVSIISKACL